MISGFSRSSTAVIGIFVEQGGDDFAGEVAVFGEVIAFLHLLGAFLAGERLLLVGDVANQIERIEGGADFLIQRGKDDALLLQLLDDGAFLVGLLPGREEGIERGVGGADVLAGVVAQALGDDFAVVAHVLDALFDDGDFHAIDGDFAAALRRTGSS